jgi:predicted transcriptional regulator
MIKSATISLLCLALMPHYSYAQQAELHVGAIDVLPLQWGKQAAVFEVTNNVNNVKYVTVEAKVQFSGSILNPSNRTTSNYLLKPLETRRLSFDLYIPTSFGKADVTISFYDVADTLDVLLPSQVFFTQSYSITFDIPAKLRSYIEEKVPQLSAAAPMIGRNPDFDSEFACALLILLDEGKTIEEIAALAEVDRAFVQEVLDSMIEKKYVRESDGSYRLTFPIKYSPTEEPEILVGDINFSSLRWGWQTATFEVTNNSNDLKYVTAEIEVQFTGSYLNPNRRTRSHSILKPLQSQLLTPRVFIPGNYGQAQITVSLYDVVDTLDILLPGQRFFQQPFSINFSIPDEMVSYFNEKITLPPRVGRHPDFDYEFSRVMLFMLNEGKKIGEIAEMAMADTSFVDETVQNMTAKGYLIKNDGGYKTSFPLITISEAETAKKLAGQLADTLATLIEKNMKNYPKILDSLMSTGAVDKDSNSFLDGGAVLYRPYPVVSALLLWFDLGQKFITRSAPLWIYDGTDLCNAYIPQYMYAVQGGDTFNGTQLYALFSGGQELRIIYGDVTPVIDCPEDYILKAKLKQRVDWQYAREYWPESFILDTLVVRPVLAALASGTDSLLEDAYYKLRDIAVKYGHEKLLFGERYWFWNLVATRVLKELTDKGVVTRRGNGQFQFFGPPE